MLEMQERIEVPQQYARQVSEYAEFIQSGEARQLISRGYGAAPPLYSSVALAEESFNPRGPSRVFMDPRAAYAMAKKSKKPLQFHRWLGPRGMRKLQQLYNQPDISQIHIDALLTQISVAYTNGDLIGDQVFPRVQVDAPSDLYFIFDQAPWLRDEGTSLVRGISARSARGGWTASTGTYRTERYTFETAIDDLQRQAADAPVDLDRNGTRFVTDKINLRVEKIVAALVFTAANWPGVTLSSTDQWSDPGSNPFTNWKTARLAVRQATGYAPNTLVFGVQAFESLALHPGLLDRIKYTGTADRPAAVTAAMMAALAGVERVLIGGAVENTAPEQIPDVSTLAFIWGPHVWMGYVPPAPARENPSSGYIFSLGRKMDRYREEETTSDILRAEENLDVAQTSRGSGYLWTNAVNPAV